MKEFYRKGIIIMLVTYFQNKTQKLTVLKIFFLMSKKCFKENRTGCKMQKLITKDQATKENFNMKNKIFY
jgi:hypothetical protein